MLPTYVPGKIAAPRERATECGSRSAGPKQRRALLRVFLFSLGASALFESGDGKSGQATGTGSNTGANGTNALYWKGLARIRQDFRRGAVKQPDTRRRSDSARERRSSSRLSFSRRVRATRAGRLLRSGLRGACLIARQQHVAPSYISPGPGWRHVIKLMNK